MPARAEHGSIFLLTVSHQLSRAVEGFLVLRYRAGEEERRGETDGVGGVCGEVFVARDLGGRGSKPF